MSALSDLRRDYRAALLRFLSTRSESARVTGYDIGRHAVERGISVLDVACVHHEVLAEVLEQTPCGEHALQTRRAADFFLEVLATFGMAPGVTGSDRTVDRAPG